MGTFKLNIVIWDNLVTKIFPYGLIYGNIAKKLPYCVKKCPICLIWELLMKKVLHMGTFYKKIVPICIAFSQKKNVPYGQNMSK